MAEECDSLLTDGGRKLVTRADIPNSPSLTDIEAALRKTTEHVAHEVARPGNDLPGWTEFEWRIAKAAVSMQGVAGLLWSERTWKGAESWTRFLREQGEHGAGRHKKIAQKLAEIDGEARRQNVPLVALKGAALYARGIYREGERPMADIDLLGRQSDLTVVTAILNSCGYSQVSCGPRHQVYAALNEKKSAIGRLGEHVDDPIKVELHWKISEHLPVAEVDITRFVFPVKPRAGLNDYASSAGLMLHLLLHASGNMRAHALRNIQLHDIALLGSRFQRDDWEDLLAAETLDQTLWWALPPLLLVAHYYSGTPAQIIDHLRTRCPRRLVQSSERQQLTDVSWSNIRIQAFPGIEWARSFSEALRFMRGRIWPSPKARSELAEAAADIPGVSTMPWYALSHRARIARWLLGRPPRVQTLLSVRAALAREI